MGGDVKLDPDLMRDFLLYVEEKADRPISALEDIHLPGYSAESIAYHVVLAAEAGFIKAQLAADPDTDDPDVAHVSYIVERLTYRGHELIEAARLPDNWQRIKSLAATVGSKGADALFEAGKAVIAQKIKEHLGLP